MSQKITATHERVDDIPVIIAQLKKMRVAALLDHHFPTNGNWTGLSLGWVTVVWLSFILSAGEHRLYHVRPWATEHRPTLRPGPRTECKRRECPAGRVATVPGYLHVTPNCG